MTDTNKPVTRCSCAAHPRHGRQIIITVGEGDVVQLRLKREQRTVCLPLSHLYDYAEARAAASAANFNTAPCKDPTKHAFLSS